MRKPGSSRQAAVLTRDTTREAECVQVEAWRRMSPLRKMQLVGQMTSAAVSLARAGVRLRHPGASERECFLRIAALKLGPALVRRLYPDAAHLPDL